MTLTQYLWIGIDARGSQRMNPTEFSKPLTLTKSLIFVVLHGVSQ